MYIFTSSNLYLNIMPHKPRYGQAAVSHVCQFLMVLYLRYIVAWSIKYT